MVQKLEKVVYVAHAVTSGGRDGRSVTSDGKTNIKMVKPRELGGLVESDGANPEQLFAMTYSACFLGAIRHVAGQTKLKVPDNASINGIVNLGTVPGGFGISVELKISLPGMRPEIAQDLIDKAHKVCPYSNATRDNIDVKLTLI
jgi:Ohr subfamily peroxiredoxin